MKKIAVFSFYVLLSQAAGIFGSIFTIPAISNWYVYLDKPTWGPPNWLFGPVWTTLYLLMGIAAYLIWDKGRNKKSVKKALKLFYLQLALNSLWSIIFFGLKSPSLAFLEILILWAVILKTMLAFKKISKPAYYLFVPYLIWVTFAAILNLSIVLLNR